jgi:signal transduction histidine kinase
LEEQRDKVRGTTRQFRKKTAGQTGRATGSAHQLSHQLEEATHAKLVFFTNIAHDFRTPLTLVADPVEHLLADHTTNWRSASEC